MTFRRLSRVPSVVFVSQLFIIPVFKLELSVSFESLYEGEILSSSPPRGPSKIRSELLKKRGFYFGYLNKLSTLKGTLLTWSRPSNEFVNKRRILKVFLSSHTDRPLC